MSDVLSNDDLNALAGEYVLGTLDHDERKGASALLEVDPTFRGVVRIWEKRFGELHLMVEAVVPDPQLWERIRPKLSGVEQVPPAIPSKPAEPGLEPEAAAVSAPPAGETAPADATAAATADAELQLAELAALLPVTTEPGTPEPPPPPAPADPLARTTDHIQRGFVPPPPMIRRSPPAPVAVPVRKSGRGWMAMSLVMGLVAVTLAGLISAWRFFPERLPDKLRAYTVLHIPVPAPSAPPAPPPPPPPVPFEE